MKKIIAFFLILFVSVFSYGQAHEGLVEYQKKSHPAAVIELPYPPGVVNDAMSDYLSKKGKSKGNDIKGFITYRNTQPVQNDSSNADLYFKTEHKSSREKEVTVVSLLLMTPDAQASTGTIRYLGVEEAKNYLNGLATAIEAYDLELSIKTQNDGLIKAEAKYKTLANEGDDLEKKRKAIETKIIDNKNDQQLQLKEIENQKQKLAQWVIQRKA
jgi:hypothetical protein